MNYYIKGNPERAKEIKAAFEKLGCDTGNLGFTSSQLYYTIEGRVELMCTKSLQNLIKTHPDYKELELPVEFKDGDIIGFNDCTHNDGSYIDWVGIYEQRIETNQHLFHCVMPSCRSFSVGGMWRVFTAYPATKEQRDLLFAKMREAGYQWDADKKELSKIIKPKFKVGDSLQTGSYFTKILSINIEEERYYCDNRIISVENQDLWHLVPKPHYNISNFKPFDKVLVRDSCHEKWAASLFSNYDDKDSIPHHFMCIDSCYTQCIPFDGNEHLLGTTDPCDEQYINW